MDNIKNVFVKKMEPNAILLFILIIILIICLLYIDDITSYLNNKMIKHQKEKFSNTFSPNDPNKNKYHSLEGFQTQQENTVVAVKSDTKADTVMGKVYDRNYIAVVEPKTRSVKLSFNKVQPSELDEGIKEMGYLLVLAKYNNLLKKIGHINAKISNEGIDIENYLNKHSNIFPTDEAKDKVRKVVKDNVSSSSALSVSVLQVFSNNNTTMDLSGLKTAEQDNTMAYFELLEILYNVKFAERALHVEPSSSYNTGIIDLYNDLRLLDTINLKPLDQIEITRNTPTTFGSNINVNDVKFELIVKNRQDSKLLVDFIKRELASSSVVNSALLEFLFKYLNKYENLSMTEENSQSAEGICTRDGICSYTFENLEDKDANGNYYYYKLGVALIYNKGTETYVEEVSRIHTYKFGTGGRLMYFKLDNSLEEQERLLKRLEEIERSSLVATSQKKQQQLPENIEQQSNVQDMEAYMKLLRPHIGNYPDEFTLNEQEIREFSLSDYLNKSVNLGQINLNVNIADDPQFPTN